MLTRLHRTATAFALATALLVANMGCSSTRRSGPDTSGTEPAATTTTNTSGSITASGGSAKVTAGVASLSDPAATLIVSETAVDEDAAALFGAAVSSMASGVDVSLSRGELIGPAFVAFTLAPDFDATRYVPAVVWQSDDGSWELLESSWTPGDSVVEVVTTHFSIAWPIKIDTSQIANGVVDWLKGLVTGRAGAENPTCGDENAARAERVQVTSDSGDLVKWCFGRDGGRDVVKITNNWRAGTQVTFPKSWSVVEYQGTGFQLQALGDWLDSRSRETSTTLSRLVGPGQTIVLDPGVLPTGSTTMVTAEASTVSWLWSIALTGVDMYLLTVGKLARLSGDTKAEDLLDAAGFIKCFTDHYGQDIDVLAPVRDSTTFDTITTATRFGLDCGKDILENAVKARGGILGKIGAAVIGVLAAALGIVYGLINALFSGIRQLIDEIGALFDGGEVGGYGYDIILYKGAAEVPPATTAAPTTSCPDFVFNEHGDMTDSVTVSGVDCSQAAAIILQIGAQHYPWGDAPTFTVDGLACTFTELPLPADEAGASGRYSCSDGTRNIEFEFYAGE